LLTRLVDKSLVFPDELEVLGRYRMLETIRQYASEKLLEANEGRRTENRQGKFFRPVG